MYSRKLSVLIWLFSVAASCACLSPVRADKIVFCTATYDDVQVIEVTKKWISFKPESGKIVDKPLKFLKSINVKNFPALNKAERLRAEGKKDEAIAAYKKGLRTLKSRKKKWLKKYHKLSDANKTKAADVYLKMYSSKWPKRLLKLRLEQLQAPNSSTATAENTTPKKKKFCRKCQGRKKVRCTQCNGSGNIKCSKCGGNWHKLCNNCRGKGKVPYRISKRYYNPHRGYYYKTVTRWRNCGYCHAVRLASGKIIHVTWECRCAKNRYPGHIKCSNCTGSGRLSCLGCGGTGLAKEEPKPAPKPPTPPKKPEPETTTAEVKKEKQPAPPPAKPEPPVDISKLDPLASPDNLAAVIQHKCKLKNPKDEPSWDSMTSLQKEIAEEQYKKSMAAANEYKAGIRGNEVTWTVCVADIVKNKKGVYVVTALSQKGFLVTCHFPATKRAELGTFKKDDHAKIRGKILDYRFDKNKPSSEYFFDLGTSDTGMDFGVLIDGLEMKTIFSPQASR